MSPFDVVQLTDEMPDEEVAKLKGVRLTKDHYGTVYGGKDVRILKPNGGLLLQLKTKAIPEKMASDALPFILSCKEPITNRGTAAGVQAKEVKYQGKTIHGYKTNTTRVLDKFAREAGSSATVGYYDRYPRFPYCRVCRYTESDPQGWGKFVKICNVANRTFKQFAPEQYARQKALAEQTDPAWVIGKTAYTTVTVNRNFATACHQDVGDFAQGFGCLAYLSTGSVVGGTLVIPKYRVAVRLEHLDILLFDVHEWHGNTIINKKFTKGDRITLVFYYRENMVRCGTPLHEYERSKHCRTIGKLYDSEEVARGDEIIKRITNQ